MKNKNKTTHKILLMGIAAVLVATISIGATLAYLTASTTPANNTFSAAGDISGRTYEPSWNVANATNIAPGKTVEKDPRVDNETSNMYIWVGSRLTFEIDAGSGYKEVTYSVFAHFVDVKTDTKLISDTGGIGANWVEYTSEVTKNTGRKYYFYNAALEPDTDAVTETALTTTKAADNTTPIFTTVTPKKEIVIDPSATAIDASTLTTTTDLSTTKFKQFNFRITIDSYGTKAYKESSSESGAVSSNDAKAEILIKLDGASAA